MWTLLHGGNLPGTLAFGSAIYVQPEPFLEFIAEKPDQIVIHYVEKRFPDKTQIGIKFPSGAFSFTQVSMAHSPCPRKANHSTLSI